jgi:hypothetical protein
MDLVVTVWLRIVVHVIAGHLKLSLIEIRLIRDF